MLRSGRRRRFHVFSATMSIAKRMSLGHIGFAMNNVEYIHNFLFYKRLTRSYFLYAFFPGPSGPLTRPGHLITCLCVRRDFHSLRLSQSVLVSLSLFLSLFPSPISNCTTGTTVKIEGVILAAFQLHFPSSKETCTLRN